MNKLNISARKACYMLKTFCAINILVCFLLLVISSLASENEFEHNLDPKDDKSMPIKDNDDSLQASKVQHNPPLDDKAVVDAANGNSEERIITDSLNFASQDVPDNRIPHVSQSESPAEPDAVLTSETHSQIEPEKIELESLKSVEESTHSEDADSLSLSHEESSHIFDKNDIIQNENDKHETQEPIEKFAESLSEAQGLPNDVDDSKYRDSSETNKTAPNDEETALHDSKRIIKELLEDSKGATDSTESIVRDSNIQQPIVIGNASFDSSRLNSGRGTDQNESRESGKEEDMKTFHEWKEKVIQEQQQKGIQKDITNGAASDGGHTNNGATSSNGGHSNGSPAASSHFSIHQFTQNFASADCGAKVVDASPKAQSRDSILQLDKDKYMNIPCDEAKKYFVVELCDPIQLKAIEIGCFELFSSLIENFSLYASDRYPTRDWKSLGNFTAKNERSLQSFLLSDPMYYKYIKVDYLSHYGKEHYCPISHFKTFGLTIEVEDDDVGLITPENGGVDGASATSEDVAKVTSEKQQQEQANKNSNVLSTVTDAMAKIASKFIGGGSSAPVDIPTVAENVTSGGVFQNSSIDSQTIASESFDHPVTPDVNILPDTREQNVTVNVQPNDSFDVKPPDIKGKTTVNSHSVGSSSSSNHRSVGGDLKVVYNVSSAIPPCEVPTPLCNEDLEQLLSYDIFKYRYAMAALVATCSIHPNWTGIGSERVLKNNLENVSKDGETNKKEVALDVNQGEVISQSLNGQDEKTKSVDGGAAVKNGGNGGNGHVYHDDMQHITGSSTSKESLLMRLKNKVRELEFNMSLSSEYLEELSKRYKKQMDDITSKHNKTLTALISTNEEAASRDVKHAQKISELETEVSKLTQHVIYLEHRFDEMNEGLFWRHGFFILIEFVVFLLLILFKLKYLSTDVTKSHPSARETNLDFHINQPSEFVRSSFRSSSETRVSESQSDTTLVRRSFSDLTNSIEDLLVPQATPFRKQQPQQRLSSKMMTKGEKSLSVGSGGIGGIGLASKKRKSKHKRGGHLFSTSHFELDNSCNTAAMSFSMSSHQVANAKKQKLNSSSLPLQRKIKSGDSFSVASRALSVI